MGKSETAIELVKRGHRLIADDAVEIRRVSAKTLVGSAPDNIRHFIELRGIGIVNARRIFGMGAVKVTEKIDMVIQLEQWDSEKVYDRMGLDSEYADILGITVPMLTIPVKPGRNLAIIIEVAAMNNRQKKMGYNAAQELMHNLGMDDQVPPPPRPRPNGNNSDCEGDPRMNMPLTRVVADLHCHTVASTHAYSTVTELARAAAEQRLLAIAYRSWSGRPRRPPSVAFGNMDVLPPSIEGVRVLHGMEANVMDFSGRLDLPEERFSRWISLLPRCTWCAGAGQRRGVYGGVSRPGGEPGGGYHRAFGHPGLPVRL